jgi:hypothetical protein
MFRTFLFIAAVCCCCLLLHTSSGRAEERRTIVTKLGNDTVAVEEIFAGSNRIHGTSVARAPKTTIREYSATFSDKGVLENVHIKYQRFSGTGVNERDYTYNDDSVRISVRQDTSTTHYMLGAKGRPFPLLVDIFGIWQAAIQKAVSNHENEFSVIGGRQILTYRIDKLDNGSLDLVNTNGDFGPIHVVTGESLTLSKFDMTATTDKFIAAKSGPIDVMAMAKEFVARDNAGTGVGILSPRDTTRAEISGAHILIDYGRPALRGRKIFGNVVPWDSVWRTGANAATQLITDKDLKFGDLLLPAGTYSIFTLPQKSGWTLIINKKHGQWGTEYSQADDFARIPLTLKSTDFATERFTFDIIPMAEYGLLRFSWDHSEASVMFTAVK